MREFRELYDGRSNAAHGGKTGKKDEKRKYFKSLKNLKMARKYLSKAIMTLTQLDTKEVINAGEDIAKQVEKMVIENAFLRIQ